MATISNYDSSSISTLFSSLNSKSSSTTAFLGSTTDLLGINYSDYATIKSGSYYKLMKAYYTIDNNDSNSAVNEVMNKNTSTAKDSASKLSNIEEQADKVNAAADELLLKGSKSLFTKKQVTDESGRVTEQYDTDAIYKAVKQFANSYNNLVEEACEANTSNISRAAKTLANLTKANERLLNQVGITIDEDNQLQIDEDVFKKADMSKVKSLFNTTGGYGYQASAQASMLRYYAESEASKSNTYGSTGKYTYNYSTGEIYDTGI